MNCIYHPANPAHVGCSSCGRGLCPACDHRIKGSPFCQDCIVAGIDLLRRGRRESARGESGATPRIKLKSPRVAALLALVPGLGAAYNGQNIKALFHFAVTAGLWHTADMLSRPFEPLLMLAGFAFYLYTIYDAKQSAERQRAGEDLRLEDERIRRSLRERSAVWGGILIGVGALSLLHIFFDAQLYGLWPLLLIAAGVYLLRGFQRLAQSEPDEYTHHTVPPSVISTPYERRSSDYPGFEARRYDQGR